MLDIGNPVNNNQSITLCDTLYGHKFVNRNYEQTTKRNHLIASQMKPLTSQGRRSSITSESRRAMSVAELRKNPNQRKSSGSLYPKLREIESIQKLDRKQRIKQGTLKKKIFSQDPHLSKLQVYFCGKNIDREQQNNLLFVTSETQPTQISDQQMNDRFSQFVCVQENYSAEKNMRAILNLTTTVTITEQQKTKLVGKQKVKLEKVAKGMLNDFHNRDLKQNNKNNSRLAVQQVDASNFDEFESEEFLRTEEEKETKSSQNNQKGIEWVLKECKKYQKKFKVKMCTNNFAKKHKNKVKM